MSFAVRLMTTGRAYDRLLKLDADLIGSPDYFGAAWFWHYDYRHELRGASHATRRRVHAAMLAAGLDVSEASERHEAIVQRLTR